MKIIQYIVHSYLEDMHDYLGDVITEFENLYYKLAYNSYKYQRNDLKFELLNFKKAVKLLDSKPLKKYYSKELKKFEKYFKLYCFLHDKEINK